MKIFVTETIFLGYYFSCLLLYCGCSV